jgi:hypothetical protein
MRTWYKTAACVALKEEINEQQRSVVGLGGSVVGVMCWRSCVDVDGAAVFVDEVNSEVDVCLLWLYMLMC